MDLSKWMGSGRFPQHIVFVECTVCAQVGGALHLYNRSSASLSQCTFISNSARAVCCENLTDGSICGVAVWF